MSSGTKRLFLRRFFISYLIVFSIGVIGFFGVRFWMQLRQVHRVPSALNVEVKQCSVEDRSVSYLVRSGDSQKPYLIFVHGGPGFPFPGVGTRDALLALNASFNVVFFDLFGSSYEDQGEIVSAVINDVVRQYSLEGITLMTHGVGVIPVMLALRESTQLVQALGVISPVLNGEQFVLESYRDVRDYADQEGVLKAIKSLNDLGEPPYDDPKDYLILSTWISVFNRQFESESLSYKYLFRSFVFSADYSVLDIVHLIRNRHQLLDFFHDKYQNFDFSGEFDRLDVPVVVLESESTFWPHLEDKEAFKVFIRDLALQ